MRYETKQDRMAQREIMQAFCDAFNRDYIEEEPFHFYDYTLMKGKDETAICEVKDRNFTLEGGVCYPESGNTFWTVMLDVPKVDEMLALANRENLTPLFIIRCFNGIFWTELREDYKIKQKGGRTKQTRDEYDIEPTYMIPADEFVPL